MKYFSQVLAGVTNAQVVTDPPGFVLPGQTAKVPFTLTEADRHCDVILLTKAPFATELTVTAPDGTVVTARSDATDILAPAMRCLRLPLPLASAPQAHAGIWTANISVDGRALRKYAAELEERRDSAGWQRLQAHGLSFILNVHAASDLRMHVSTTQSGTTAGSVVEVLALLTESGIPLGRQAAVTADLTMPDGTARVLVLEETEPGVFRATLPLPQLGHYPLLVKATGRSFGGAAFTREELRSAATWTQPPVRPAGPPTDGTRWCELLLCLLEQGGTARALEERGVDLDAVRACLKRFCERRER